MAGPFSYLQKDIMHKTITVLIHSLNAAQATYRSEETVEVARVSNGSPITKEIPAVTVTIQRSMWETMGGPQSLVVSN